MNQPLKRWERIGLVAVLLLAWGLRWMALMEAPPGWRDDDLIELYTFSQRILESGPQLYFAGASGHEPLYHTLRALLLSVAGLNQASARWMAATFGTLSVLLTWAIGRRMFTRATGLLAGALVALSFWGLMYSRVAIRHIGALPWMLCALYWGWRLLQDERPPAREGVIGLALGTAGALLTYYAGRLMPPLMLVALPFVGTKSAATAKLGRPYVQALLQDKVRWRRYLIGVMAGALLAAPMFWAAMRVPGGDARVSEVAVPITALLEGDVGPLIETMWTTLGMFHAKGDPEWLYNIRERPVFGLAGALVFYSGVATRLWHWDQPTARMLLLWFGVGIAPAFISLPPSSYGHTILALPAVYLLLSMPMKAAARRWAQAALPVALLTLGLVAMRDLPDYFVRWPQHSMVRFLYRADYRALAEYVDAHPEMGDVSVGSFLAGPWDKAAFQTDIRRPDVSARWMHPARALATNGGAMRFYTQEEIDPHPAAAALLSEVIAAPEGMLGYRVTLPAPPADALTRDIEARRLADQPYGDALVLDAVRWSDTPTPGATIQATVWWRVIAPLPLPEEQWHPHPPPPDVYNGPRLKVFAHLMGADGALVAIDDGLWVDPYSLEVGDQFVQWHRFTMLGGAAEEPLTLALGLYDPLTGERWVIPATGADRLVVAVE